MSASNADIMKGENKTSKMAVPSPPYMGTKKETKHDIMLRLGEN